MKSTIIYSYKFIYYYYLKILQRIFRADVATKESDPMVTFTRETMEHEGVIISTQYFSSFQINISNYIQFFFFFEYKLYSIVTFKWLVNFHYRLSVRIIILTLQNSVINSLHYKWDIKWIISQIEIPIPLFISFPCVKFNFCHWRFYNKSSI